ncbi:DUF4394 domain-containing protein [Actinoplanes sp. N902-109]|uniref:DUF4394 domain-containing protein n=1 Tax=Actinoplanes sp. (strain N902-109) TaxID=649831 RepID=UPI000329364A|nr:DUF4394 domain-containing protein [Actinoplanes sp. N902-109]AGL17147.1 lipoprotein [Actinoplanes sp. N902-109]
MNTTIKKSLAAATAFLAATAGALAATTGSSSAAAGTGLRAYAITADGRKMATFTVDKPDTFDWVRNITGLVGDTRAVGLDFRPNDGQLYLVGDKGGIYTIGIPSAVTTKVSQLQVPLSGVNFGVDFNPAANRLRVISDSGQDLRHNLDDHTTVSDPVLTTPPASGTTTGVIGSAYTNNDLNSATATTLFNVNTTADQVVIQSPANNGTLAATGALGIDAQLVGGMDIYSTLSNGKTVNNTAFASLVPYGGVSGLYSINLLTGEASFLGEFVLDTRDIALSLTGM